MASRLNPYISFTDNARAALEFYKTVFGGTLTLTTPSASTAPRTRPTRPRSCTASGDGQAVHTHGSRHPHRHGPHARANISISLSGDDLDELRGYWQKLSEGGSVSVPLEKQMWGDEFGMCVDKFGIGWMVDIVPQQP